MMATSLWELRKRPLPRDVASPLAATHAPPTPTPRAQTRRKPKEDCKSSRGLESAFDAADRCMYRGGGSCFAARTFKDGGARHSLCAMHRDRTIANQRRYDAKKRLKKIADAHAEATQRKEKRDRDRIKRAAKAKAEATRQAPTEAVDKAILPSFHEWMAMCGAYPTSVYDGDGVNGAGEATGHQHDASRAWLQPIQSPSSAAELATWRNDALAQFLRET